MAIGEPEVIDTAQDPRLSRIFSNRVISRYETFKDFYGMEDAIEQIVSYLKHAAQGLKSVNKFCTYSVLLVVVSHHLPKS